MFLQCQPNKKRRAPSVTFTNIGGRITLCQNTTDFKKVLRPNKKYVIEVADFTNPSNKKCENPLGVAVGAMATNKLTVLFNSGFIEDQQMLVQFLEKIQYTLNLVHLFLLVYTKLFNIR